MLRVSLVGLWGVYPIAYMFPIFGGDFFGGAGGFVLRQGGYSIADILAKAAYGLAIYKIARVKSRIEDPAYDDEARRHRRTRRPVPPCQRRLSRGRP